MEAVWPDSIVEENNLAQAISKLRQVFGETPGSHSYIVTVPGRGYRFVAEVNKRSGEYSHDSRLPESRVANVAQMQPTRLPPQKSPILRFPHSPFPTLSEGCLPRLAGYGWLGSWRWQSLASQYCLSFGIVRPIHLLAQAQLNLHRCQSRASPFCRSTISATKNKTPISPLAYRMKLCRTLRGSQISR